MNLWLIFLTGLTTGGLSCLAVQGGLLASVIANQKDDEIDKSQTKNVISKIKHAQQTQRLRTFDQHDWLPVGMFLGAKLITHTILGFLLGLLGSVLTLSQPVQLAFQFFTALFMFATAMNLLEVHPIFRYVVFQPPKFLQKYIRKTSKSQALFAPAVLGAMTVFIPCGITQAMEVVAINSGNPIWGALIMFSFVLGTMPLFAVIGVATARLSEVWRSYFLKFVAYVLILMSVFTANAVLVAINSPITLQKVTRPVTWFFSKERFQPQSTVQVVQGEQQVNIQVLNHGYEPRRVVVKAGVPVKLTLTSNQVFSCALAFTLPNFGIKTFLESTDSQTFTFTPTKPGKYTYTCSMGMYTGILEVVK